MKNFELLMKNIEHLGVIKHSSSLWKMMSFWLSENTRDFYEKCWTLGIIKYANFYEKCRAFDFLRNTRALDEKGWAFRCQKILVDIFWAFDEKYWTFRCDKILKFFMKNY